MLAGPWSRWPDLVKLLQAWRHVPGAWPGALPAGDRARADPDIDPAPRRRHASSTGRGPGRRMREARRPQRFDQARRRIAANERRGAERLTVRLASSGMIAVYRLAPSAGSAGRGLAARLGGCSASCRAQFFDGRQAVVRDRPVGRQADAIWCCREGRALKDSRFVKIQDSGRNSSAKSVGCGSKRHRLRGSGHRLRGSAHKSRDEHTLQSNMCAY